MEKQSLKSEFPGAVVREARLEGADAFFVDLNGAVRCCTPSVADASTSWWQILGFGDARDVATAALNLARTALRQ